MGCKVKADEELKYIIIFGNVKALTPKKIIAKEFKCEIKEIKDMLVGDQGT